MIEYLVRHAGDKIQVSAYEATRLVGRVEVIKGVSFPFVGSADVERSYRRKRLATRLYEMAARLVCERWEQPLRSGLVRSPEADAFWRKQYVKGRASCMEWRPWPGEDPNRKWCGRWELSCPAPESLERIK